MVRFHQRWRLIPGRTAIAVMALLVVAPGCKSWSWASRPSWMGGGNPSAAALSAAPSFDKDVPRPSEMAKPYPTTSTPEGYVLSDATRTAAGATAPATAPAAPSTVTYGATPLSSATAATPETAPAATGIAPAAAGIGPQVGPYAPLQPAADPAAAVTAGLAAAPGFGATAPPSGERMADARTSGWVPTPPTPTTPSPAPPVGPTGGGQDSRYGSTGSRFSGGGFPASPAASPEFAPAEPSASPLPAISPAVPAASPVLPGSIPPPTRRPDPGYRPAGTSSYRPARSLLAGEDQNPAVQPAGFTAP